MIANLTKPSLYKRLFNCQNYSNGKIRLNSTENVVLLDGYRTSFCAESDENKYNLIKLSGNIINETVERNKINSNLIDFCVMGTTDQFKNHLNIARDSLIFCGWNKIPGITISNDNLTSFNSILTAFAKIKANKSNVCLVGGVDESRKSSVIEKVTPKQKYLSSHMKISQFFNFFKHYDRNLHIETKTPNLNNLFSFFNNSNPLNYITDYLSRSSRAANYAKNNNFLNEIIPNVNLSEDILAENYNIENRYTEFLNIVNEDEKNLKINEPETFLNLNLKNAFNNINLPPKAQGAASTVFMNESFALKNNFSPRAFIRDIVFTNDDTLKNTPMSVLTSLSLLLARNFLFIEDISVLELHEQSAVETVIFEEAINKGKYFSDWTTVPKRGDSGFDIKHILNKWGGSLAFNDCPSATGIRMLNMAVNRLNKLEDGKFAVVCSPSNNGLGSAILLERYNR